MEELINVVCQYEVNMSELEKICEQFSLTHHALPYLEKLADLKYSISNDRSLSTACARARAYAAVSWQCMHDGTYDALARSVEVKKAVMTDAMPTDELFHSWDKDTVCVLVEPHPDDGMLGAGGIVSAYVDRLKDGLSSNPVYDCIAVSGGNSVDDSFSDELSDAENDVLLSEYQRMRTLQEDCGVEIDYDMHAEYVRKGALRVFFEHVRSWATLVGQSTLASCDNIPARLVLSPVLLPCYERGELPAERDRALLQHAFDSFREHTSASRVVCLHALAGDPHGTHQWVNDLTRSALSMLSEHTGCDVKTYALASGSWHVMSCVDLERFSGKIYYQPLTKQMMHRKIEAFLQHRSQVLPQVGGDISLGFHERMVLSHAYHAQCIGVANDTHPFVELLVMS